MFEFRLAFSYIAFPSYLIQILRFKETQSYRIIRSLEENYLIHPQENHKWCNVEKCDLQWKAKETQLCYMEKKQKVAEI
jgi:hypothetical protein